MREGGGGGGGGEGRYKNTENLNSPIDSFLQDISCQAFFVDWNGGEVRHTLNWNICAPQ